RSRCAQHSGIAIARTAFLSHRPRQHHPAHHPHHHTHPPHPTRHPPTPPHPPPSTPPSPRPTTYPPPPPPPPLPPPPPPSPPPLPPPPPPLPPPPPPLLPPPGRSQPISGAASAGAAGIVTGSGIRRLQVQTKLGGAPSPPSGTIATGGGAGHGYDRYVISGAIGGGAAQRNGRGAVPIIDGRATGVSISQPQGSPVASS